MMPPSPSSWPPSPNGRALSLVSALSNPLNHQLHVLAIRAHDDALSASLESYGQLCLQLAFCLVGSDRPSDMLSRIPPTELDAWRQTDSESVLRLQQDPSLWIPFGQTAGLLLKNALLRPPTVSATPALTAANGVDGKPFFVPGTVAAQLQMILLCALGCQHSELRAVASTIIATTAVSAQMVQPHLHVQAWTGLIAALIHNMNNLSSSELTTSYLAEGSLLTVRKIMEDGPRELGPEDLDYLIPVLIRFLQPGHPDQYQVSALQSLVACIAEGMMPSALVAHFSDYLTGLSTLAANNDLSSPLVRTWVCRSIVTLLEFRTEYVRPHLSAICTFMLHCTANSHLAEVALEACEFWLTFANLEGGVSTPEMHDTVGALLPQLIPILVRNMVYAPDEQEQLVARNELDEQGKDPNNDNMRPIFHKSRSHPAGGAQHVRDDNADDDDGDDDGLDHDDGGDDPGGGDFDDEDGNAWTLRKCAAASLDSLANLFGAELILPGLLPCLENGLANTDPWVQEASILALGAVAEGCHDAMGSYMGQLHPYLISILATPEGPGVLPQVKSIAAWTVGRYAGWAVEQVQHGVQGHLLAQLTEVLLARILDKNRRIQVACCSAFGVVVEASGDLMAPYLQPIYQQLVAALSRYRGRSLLILFDVFGIMADCCGPAIAEGNLPAIYLPPLISMWEELAKRDPSDKTLLPLMESLASIAVTSGLNFQPYSLECFENAMAMIEMVTLQLAQPGDDDALAAMKEEEFDPIICATDMLDGLVEGLGASFQQLLASSSRYGPLYLTVLLSLCKHQVAGIRMSAFALLGDLASLAPVIIEPAAPQLLREAVACIDPTQPTVCINAVWAVGEICVHYQSNPGLLEPLVPTLMQNLISLLVGNGFDRRSGGSDVPGLAENAAACVGRLARVNPNFVAPDLPRFLMGWCDAMSKIRDLTEKRDAFQGFVQAVYVNPLAIQQASHNVGDVIASILFAIVTWHVPTNNGDEHIMSDPTAFIDGNSNNYYPFPPAENELKSALTQLIQDLKSSVSNDLWTSVQRALPVGIRRLLQEVYHVK